jgi:phytoene synthase
MTDAGAPRAEDRTLDSAFALCERLARSHYENFPVASRLVPARLRPHVWNLYAFARIADDYADEPEYEGRRLELLQEWENRLDRCLDGDPDHPVFVALGETIARFDLPVRPLRDLLDAFRQDCTVSRYESWSGLLDYCSRSANPVGRLMLGLFGYRDEQRCQWSDAICTALQLTNFWQDVAIDWSRGRVYLPAEDLRRHGVAEEDLGGGRVGPGFRALLAELVARTRERFEAGRPLPGSVGGRLGIELRVVRLGGLRILERIEQAGYDVFRSRPKLSRPDLLRAAGRALLGD